MHPLPVALESMATRAGLRCTWAYDPVGHGAWTVSGELPNDFCWSADGKRMWTSNRARTSWTEWDAATGQHLCESSTPEGSTRAVLPPEVARTALAARPPGPRRIVAVSPQRHRAVTVAYHGGHGALLHDGDGQVIGRAEGSQPFAFSPDGRRIAATVYGQAMLAILDAETGKVLSQFPFDHAVGPGSEATWAPGGVLLLRANAGGQGTGRIICFHVEEQKTQWHQAGNFLRAQVSADLKHAAGMAWDGSVHVWDLANGRVITVVPKERLPVGPLVFGEPDTLALLARLTTHPVAFKLVLGISMLRLFPSQKHALVSGGSVLDVQTGAAAPDQPVPWAVPSAGQQARALQALAVKVSSHAHRAASRNGNLQVYLLCRNPREWQDPDAGRLTEYDVTVGLWNEAEGRWCWETGANPGPFMLGWLLEHGAFEFSWDERGLFVTGQGMTSPQLFDVATGQLRPRGVGDVMPQPAGLHPQARVLAASLDGARCLTSQGSTLDIRDVNSGVVTHSLDLTPLHDEATAAACVDGSNAFLFGTRYGRIMHCMG